MFSHLVPPGISILEKLHSEEKYLGRNETEARLDCSCLFLVPWHQGWQDDQQYLIVAWPHLAHGEQVDSAVVAGHTQQAAVAVKVDAEYVCWLRAPEITKLEIPSK